MDLGLSFIGRLPTLEPSMRGSWMPALQNDDYNTVFGSESIVSQQLE